MKRFLGVSVSLIALLVSAGKAQTADNSADHSILYSGQLDGFLGSTPSCFRSDCTALLDAAALQIRDLKLKSKGSILIGMGDNFAPDPGRYFNAQMDVHQRQDPRFDVDHFHVIDFLRGAQYDAVVPGVQDFYFGAEFVRRSEEVVKMVATNLVRTPMQPTTCPAFPPLPAVTILLPNQISSSIASGSSASAAGAAGGGGGGGGGKGKGGKKGGGGGGAGGATGRICYTFNVNDDEVNHACSTIKVQEPMFKHAWQAPNDTNYVIVGALAPDTLSGLSTIDTTWYEEKHTSRVGRQVTVNDPTSAIVQALRAFTLLNPLSTNVYGVLLAQMPPSEAKSLADNLGESSDWQSKRDGVAARVNVIFSGADLVEASPKLSVEIDDPTQIPANSSVTYYIPVFTPGPVFQKRDCLASGHSVTECLSQVIPSAVPVTASSTASGAASAVAPGVVSTQVPAAVTPTTQGVALGFVPTPVPATVMVEH